MSKHKRPRIFNQDDLEIKGTKELLGYLKRLNQCEESFELSDMEINEDLVNPEIIYFKKTEKWITAHKTVKLVLSTREHIN